jgi:hypothetical protein
MAAAFSIETQVGFLLLSDEKKCSICNEFHHEDPCIRFIAYESVSIARSRSYSNHRAARRQRPRATALGRSDYPTEQPLREILLIARHCSGGVILGFEQFRANSGVSKPGTSAEKLISTPTPFPTPWNHLESGILFGLRLPILVFREDGITGGVFDNGVSDVFVDPIPSPNIEGAAKAALRQVFQRWAGKVREHYYGDKGA